jgi:hypothetical protein
VPVARRRGREVPQGTDKWIGGPKRVQVRYTNEDRKTRSEELPGEENETVFSLGGGGLSEKSDWSSSQEKPKKRITIENAESYARRRKNKEAGNDLS